MVQPTSSTSISPGVGTGEYAYDENWNRYEIKTPDVLYDIGTSGEHNIIATIHHAEVTGGSPSWIQLRTYFIPCI